MLYINIYQTELNTLELYNFICRDYYLWTSYKDILKYYFPKLIITCLKLDNKWQRKDVKPAVCLGSLFLVIYCLCDVKNNKDKFLQQQLTVSIYQM